jgi:hypothetical protein
MPKSTLGLLAAAALALLGTAPAGAVGTRHPFCIQGETIPALSDCSYDSLEQCRATASGRILYCLQNPYYVPEGAARTDRHRHVVPVYPLR